MPEETGANSSGERGTSGSGDVLRGGGVSGETGAGEPTLTYPPYPKVGGPPTRVFHRGDARNGGNGLPSMFVAAYLSPRGVADFLLPEGYAAPRPRAVLREATVVAEAGRHAWDRLG